MKFDLTLTVRTTDGLASIMLALSSRRGESRLREQDHWKRRPTEREQLPTVNAGNGGRR